MNPANKVYIGVIALIVGVVLFTFGLSPIPNTVTEVAMIIVGGALIFGYALLTWEWFEQSFGGEARGAILAPALGVLGIVIIYQAITVAWIAPPHNIISGAAGLALIIGPSLWIATR